MSLVGLAVHHERPDARVVAQRVAAWLTERGHHAWIPTDDASEMGLAEFGDDRPLADAELVLSLGGDGTMLRAVGMLDGAPVPLLGVNLGRLGYLTEVEPEHLEASLERFFAGSDEGQWQLDERMMLDVGVSDASGAAVGTWRALNEAVVEKQLSGHTVHLRVHINGEAFTTYSADGLIVSTPTGSTAYSLSARGPVVSPKHRALLVTPVAPHMLFDRSLVLDPSETVDVEVVADRDASVAIDGQEVCQLTPGARVRCTPSASTARFVRFGAHHYHQVLRTKFGLTDRSD